MVHCPECETVLSEQSDVEFVEMDSSFGFLAASKRFYLVACNECGVALGSGVAAAK